MCGIIGIFAPSNPAAQWPTADLEAMVAALRHRGPDEQGMHTEPGLFFGHTRLAVLDLSSAGRQPMASKNGRYLICFNGEIYNFQELRQELGRLGHEFHTHTDTEVLLAAWVEWGGASLARLDGIFAFALFDRLERTLHLVRDHLGVKPLFYWQESGILAFASEPLALFGSIISCPEAEPADLDTYFTYNYIPAPGTGLKNLRQLPPGHLLSISIGQFSLMPYWSWRPRSDPVPWSLDAQERFCELITRSVTSQLVSDAPLGLFLSGGLDSATVALGIHGAGRQPTAFCLGFEQSRFDETPAAAAFARTLGMPLRSSCFQWSEETIRATLAVMREPMADASCFPMHQLALAARQECTVILAGDGGDELLAGYDTYKASQWTPWIRRIPVGIRNVLLSLTPCLPADQHRYSPRLVMERLLIGAAAGPWRDHASWRRIFSPELKRRLYEEEFLLATEHLDPVGAYADKMLEIAGDRSPLTAWQYADLHHFLPSVLAKVDRMSMATGLEVRVPLLNRELVEFCFQLPDEARRFKGKGKRILREWLVSRLSREHLSRPKAGFLPPVDGWFRHAGPMFVVFQQHLDWARQGGAGWLRWDEVARVWQEHQRGRLNVGFALLGILQFINWHRHQKGVQGW
ncbi:MAG: asparagine synthase (glutamine-hydrolyzing) [Magnetococcales bacterium]|nr:asparagine synthase (glutamine-hydrolyzing) [Magnetococcales bacterium]